MQKYREINGNDYVKDSRVTINETMQSIQSMNSGTAFPTKNLFEGMKCYRTDLKKTYTLTNVENNTWAEDAHATLSDEATHAATATTANTATNASHASNADSATDVTNATVSPGVSHVAGVTVPASGVIDNLNTVTGSNDLTSTNKLRSYIGSIYNGGWYDAISIRHRNGADDGTAYGMLIYSGLTDTSSIRYRKQYLGSGWTEERTLLDSSNYNSFAPTKTGGGASGTWGINITGNANTATSVAWSGVTGKPGTYPPSAHNHDSAYPSVTGTRASGTWGINISGNANTATSVAWSGVTDKPGTYPPSAHNHDSAYPSVTGTRASGTWGISISGNANTASSVAWDGVTGKPGTYPPSGHSHSWDQTTGKPGGIVQVAGWDGSTLSLTTCT